MQAFVDKNICIRCGLCANICPEVFTIDDGGMAKAVLGDIPDNASKLVKEAEESCPSSAIIVE